MRAAKETYRNRAKRGSKAHDSASGGAAGLVLGMALIVPLALIAVALAQLPGVGFAAPTNPLQTESSTAIMGKRPTSSNPAPPPTLVPPTATPRPTATPVPVAEPTVAPQKGGTYTVQPGDELKQIAAQYQVSIWKIIATNNIPNPDSLRIGQELKIPSD